MITLFKKSVIPARVDGAWAEEFPMLAAFASAPMLVVARPFDAGSREEATLMNMLKACGFAIDSVNILQMDEEAGLPWMRIRAAAEPSYALLLGVPPAQLGIAAQLPANMPAEFGGVTFIWTSTLQHLTSTEAARKLLWVDVLQPLFKKA